MADPDFPLNCPRCPQKLVYVTTERDGEAETHVYTCTVHGEYRLCPDGYLRGGVGRYGKPPHVETKH